LAEEDITVLQWGWRRSNFWLGTVTASICRRENLEENTIFMRGMLNLTALKIITLR